MIVGRVVPEHSNRSSGSTFVLVDQPAQTVVSTYPNPMVSDLPMLGFEASSIASGRPALSGSGIS
jgi:hypothetical protein